MNLTITNLLIGEFYYVQDEHSEQYLIIRNEGLKDGGKDKQRINGPTLSNMGHSSVRFSNSIHGGAWIPGRPTRLATAEEKAWLKACIAANKLVDRNLTEVAPDDLSTGSLDHTDIVEGAYYHITDNEDGENTIIRCDSRDDEYRWTGPTIRFTKDDPSFDDGSEDVHGAYFGGEYDNDDLEIRYATANEIAWLTDCIEAGELVDRPSDFIEDHIPTEEELIGKIKDLLHKPSNGEGETPEFLNKFLQKPKTMDKYITEITPDMVGRHVKCRIDGKRVTEAVITVERGNYYLCQDVADGAPCDDKGGYKYAWNCVTGTSEDLQRVTVSSMEFIEKVGKFKVGDWVLIEKNPEDRHWVADMDQYNGRIACITREKDKRQGIFLLDVDKGSWNWSDKSFKESGTVSLKSTDLVKDEIYVFTGDTPKDHIFRSDVTGKDRAHCDLYMLPVTKYYTNSGGNLGAGPLRTATPKEKAHLLACIKAEKYVDPPKEEEEVLPVAMDIDPEILAEILNKL